MPTRSVVITGTWGSGKTAILESLGDAFAVVPEPARPAITEDPSLLDDWSKFSEVLLQRSIADFGATRPGVSIFDRGIPDCLAYARWFGLEETPYRKAATTHRYEPQAMICPPWEEIYTTDELRKATFEMALDFHGVLATTYEDVGYRLTEVPRAPLRDRVLFVEEFVSNGP